MIKSENLNLPKPVVANLSLDLLETDTTIRTLSASNVEVLLNQMKNHLWEESICSFVVLQQGRKYRILNGNHRYQAMKQWNTTAEDSDRFRFVTCHIYTELSFEQIVLINAPITPFPTLPLTILQKVTTNNLIPFRPVIFSSKLLEILLWPMVFQF
jgi:hypothetical protein